MLTVNKWLLTLSLKLHFATIFHEDLLKVHIWNIPSLVPTLQAKIDILGFYHALAKGIKDYNGGTDLKHDTALYLEQNLEVFRVNLYTVNIIKIIHIEIHINEMK